MEEILRQWQQIIAEAAARGQSLRIVGGGSKDFLGQPPTGSAFATGAYRGVIAYEPAELFVSVRCGTPLAEIEALLAGQGQMLAFEPPHFGEQATIGGCLAAGLSGPRRPYAGAVRDFVLGAAMIDGKGDLLRFGGQVMKNVAGYDVSRLLAGSMGILGVVIDATFKVAPQPAAQVTLALQLPQDAALATLQRWGAMAWPLSASAWEDGRLHVRLSGSEAAVRLARQAIGGEEQRETVQGGGGYWLALREQQTDFFVARGDGQSLWRLSLPATAPAPGFPGDELIEWGGALRWLWSDAPAERIRAAAARLGGHATLFRASPAARQASGVFHPLAPAIAALHRNLKSAFDPQGIFNPGRLYPSL